MTTQQLKPPASYYGGKGRLAAWIASLMGPHRRYVEPFCGTAAVLLAKTPARFEVINDLDGDLVTFFRALRDQPDELERACRFTPYARAEFIEARDQHGEELDDIERARRWWVRVVQGFNSKPGDWRNGWSVSAAQGASGPRTAVSLVERFSAVAERLRMVAIENSPAIDVIARFDDPSAVIYCDPPYLGSTRTARSVREATKSNAYAHEMLRDDEHRELAAVLRAAAGHVLLSGYASPLYDELYAGWWRIETSVARPAAFHTGDEATRRRATEVVWSNRPLDVDEHHLFVLDTQETR